MRNVSQIMLRGDQQSSVYVQQHCDIPFVTSFRHTHPLVSLLLCADPSLFQGCGRSTLFSSLFSTWFSVRYSPHLLRYRPSVPEPVLPNRLGPDRTVMANQMGRQAMWLKHTQPRATAITHGVSPVLAANGATLLLNRQAMISRLRRTHASILGPTTAPSIEATGSQDSTSTQM